ncbi:MAG: nuclear transport factor 2 family protein [Verrucomicrobiota bacterium]
MKKIKRAGQLAALLMSALAVTSANAELPTEPKEIITTFLKCWENGDAETFEALLAPEVRFAYPGDILNKAELMEVFRGYPKKKKDIKIYLWDVSISEGNTHVTAYEFAATDRESGERFAVGTGVWCIIENGKITDFREFWDSELVMRQKKGELPLDEGGQVTPWPETVWLRHETID